MNVNRMQCAVLLSVVSLVPAQGTSQKNGPVFPPRLERY